MIEVIQVILQMVQLMRVHRGTMIGEIDQGGNTMTEVEGMREREIIDRGHLLH